MSESSRREERGGTTGEVHELIGATIAAHIAPGARVVAVREREGGAQGFSGALLRYYDITYEQAGLSGEIALVTKEAALVERRALAWLGERGLPAPFSHTLDLTTDGPALVCMEQVGDAPLPGERARPAARALAAIGHAALGRGDELPWLPRADPAFFAERIVDTCWRGPWRHALTGAGYTDWYGRRREPSGSGDPFWAEFAVYDRPLEDAAARFLHDMAALWRAGDSLTLIHADFHGDHLRLSGGRGSAIDWESARYGSFYVDLPNYFSREEALLYRDALADLGRDIPRDQFLACYDAASRYVGFKYFGIGVLHWRPGDPPRRRESAIYWIDMVLRGAAGGRPAPTPPRAF
jgi:hypothetical protein